MVLPTGQEITREQFLGALRHNAVPQPKPVPPVQEEVESDGSTTIGLSQKQQEWKPTRYEVKGNTITVTRYGQSKNRQAVPVDQNGLPYFDNPESSQLILAEVKHLQATRQTYVRTADSLRLRRMETPFYKMYVNGEEVPMKKLLATASTAPQFTEPKPEGTETPAQP